MNRYQLPIFLVLCSISFKLTALIVESEGARLGNQLIGGAFLVMATLYAVFMPEKDR